WRTARVVDQRARCSVRDDDRFFAGFQHVQRARISDVREVWNDTQSVHSLHSLKAQFGKPRPLLLDSAAAKGIVVMVGELKHAQAEFIKQINPRKVLAHRLASLEL